MPGHVLMPDGAIKRQGDSLVPQGIVCQVNRSGNVSVATASVIPFNTKLYDPFAWFDTSTYRFTPKIAGYYRVSFTTRMSPISGWVRSQLRKNGVSGHGTLWDATFQDADPGASVLPGVVVYMNGSSDYLEVIHHASAGGSQTMVASGGTEHSQFSAELVAATVGVAPEPWHHIGAAGEPGFQNGWSNYPGYTAAAFFKDPVGMVHLKGLIRSGTVGTTAFTLPAGYRPLEDCHFAVPSNDAFAIVRVRAAGGVELGAPGSNTWMAIEGIHFRGDR